MAVSVGQRKQWVTGFLLAALGISSLGDFIYLVALNLTVLERTHSAAAVSALWAIPPAAAILTRLWSGSVVDRVDKKSVLVAMDIARGVLVLSLPLLQNLYVMYAVIFLLGVCDTLYRTAFNPYLTKLIPAEQWKRTNSLLGMTQTGAIVVGPALAGALLAFSSPGIALALNGISFLLSGLIFIFFLPKVVIEAKTDTVSGQPNIWRTILADWRAVFAFAKENAYFIFIYLLCQLATVIGMSLDSQEVVFAERVLGLDASGYSLLVSCCGVGYVLGALFVAVFARRLPLKLLIGSVVLTSVGFIVYAYAGGFWAAAFGFAVLGFFQSCTSTGFQTFYQMQVPVEKMGRISGVFGLFQSASVVLCTILVGVLADLWGIDVLVKSVVWLHMAITASIFITALWPTQAHRFVEHHEATAAAENGRALS